MRISYSGEVTGTLPILTALTQLNASLSADCADYFSTENRSAIVRR